MYFVDVLYFFVFLYIYAPPPYYRCYELFKDENAFGLPWFGDSSNVENCLLTALQWVLQRFDIDVQSICPLPSTFVVRQLWEKYTAGYVFMEDILPAQGGK